MYSSNKEYPVSMFQIGKNNRRLESSLKRTADFFVRTENKVDEFQDQNRAKSGRRRRSKKAKQFNFQISRM